MVVIGTNTRNGKAMPSERNPEKLRLEREEKKREVKRELKLEREKSKRLGKSQPKYTNRKLEGSAFETPITQRDRYAFGGKLGVRIPHPKNIIFTATSKLLAEFNTTDPHRRLDPLAVEALTDLPTICHVRETEPAVFLLGRAQTFVKLQLKLVRGSDAPGSAVTVMVRVGSQRCSLRAWLETLPKHRMPNIEKLALELQRQQWLKSGRPFRFERLPAEIRSRIFLFAVGPYIDARHPSTLFKRDGDIVRRKEFDIVGKSIEREADDEWYINARHKQLDRINLGLLAINKATREDCISVLRLDTTKRYMDLWLVEQIPRYVPAPCLTWIRRIELAFTHIEFIEMFQCQIRPFGDHFRQLPPGFITTANVLSKANLPLLKHLELTFTSTIEPIYSPWVSYEGYRPHHIDYGRLPCQKVLVDMILCFVPKWVEHIPTIKLGGFIKTETRKKWERVLNSKTPRVFDNYINSEKQAVLSMPDSNFPPRCYCPHPCGFVEPVKVRERHKRDRHCAHTYGDYYFCNHYKPKLHPIAQAAANYFFDYDDSIKVEEESDKDLMDRWAERDQWMRVKQR
ncbi:hypothetical protein B0A54_02396 [Friedmanniomyces endolithicus]|uniref:Uncharacterized protein n=1 Tax=Friedmanniomyces endolithicus TaxID=329885 RepID=A0A4U0VCA6_9PEZI|nr:hypothetical protein LTS09_000786 [Friedmanniomyces endolithicus]TKA46564.1 hypothetical protein B0A54_02396 [Friedmanniomyces endolithicus]